MKSVIVCVLWAAGLASGQTVSLFDGHSLNGWRVEAKAEDAARSFWTVRGSAITVDSLGRPDHDYVWLVYTAREFDDFVLRFKVRSFAHSPGNTGVQVRSRYDAAARWMDGPQVDIHPPAPWRSGLIYDETRGAKRWIFPSLPDWRIEPEQGPKQWAWRHSGEGDGWNHVEIRCEGWRIRTRVNGHWIADYDGQAVLDDAHHRERNVGRRGFIALQLHARDELLAQFKDLEVTSGSGR